MPRTRLWMMVMATCLGTACSIADPHRPEWLEAFGHASVRWIAATPFGVLAVVPGGKIRRYPGEWDRPWFDHLTADATQLAANNSIIWTLTGDGNIVRRNDVRAAGETLTNGGGGIIRFAVSSSGEVHVLAQGHPQRLVDGRLVDTPCAGRTAQALALAADGTYLATTTGTLALETAAGACVDVPAPFVATDLAATDVVGGRYELAAVDNRQMVWLRRPGQDRWEEQPPPVVFRPGHFRRSAAVEQVAVSALAVWARTTDGLVFIYSDPR
ncbi:MAG TPA: hypothetical protein VGL59_01180 [Polyangia bacterium]|jgi:hypothetical protein